MEWKSEIAEFVTQCYETYPQYGDDGGTLSTKIKAFAVGLEDYDISEIGSAFRHWLKENTKMPLPADIVAIANQERRWRRSIAANPVDYAPAPRRKTKTVPWACKRWKQMTEEDKQGLSEHLKNMDKERALEYCKYLRHWCGFPDLSNHVT